jgi:hypothetical protein
MINMVRNLYGNYARPCVSCPANQGSNGEVELCSIYGTQCSVCPLYAHWEKHKKSAHDTKLPLPLESHSQEVFNIPEHNFDLDKQIEELRIKLKDYLTPIQYRVYTLLFVDGKSEEAAAKILGYNTSEKGRSPGYKTIHNIRKLIIVKARKIIENDI